MANFQSMSQPARFWAFVEELETKGARPSAQSDRAARNERQGPMPGANRGMRGLGRVGRGGRGGGPGGRRARMQQAMADMQATAHEVPEEQSSDEDGFTPIATPVESVNEKEVLFGETTETEVGTENKPHRGGMAGRRGRGGPGAGFRGGFGGRGMHQGCRGREGMPSACGPRGLNQFGPRRGPRGGPFKMGGLRRALGEESSGDDRKARKPGIMKRGNAGPGAKRGNEQKPGAHKTFKPRADVFEASDSYAVNFALPGAKKDNVKLVWRPKLGHLIVSGRILRKAEDMKETHTIAQRERAAGLFERHVALKYPSSANINAHNIVAKLEDGVLRVDVPKQLTEKAFDGPFKVSIV